MTNTSTTRRCQFCSAAAQVDAPYCAACEEDGLADGVHDEEIAAYDHALIYRWGCTCPARPAGGDCRHTVGLEEEEEGADADADAPPSLAPIYVPILDGDDIAF